MTLHTFYFPLDHKIHPSWPYFHCLPLYVLSAALFSANPRLTLPKIDIVCPEMRLPSIETCFVGCRQPLFLQHQRCRVRRQRRPRLWTSIYHWRNFDVEWATGLKKLKEFKKKKKLTFPQGSVLLTLMNQRCLVRPFCVVKIPTMQGSQRLETRFCDRIFILPQ